VLALGTLIHSDAETAALCVALDLSQLLQAVRGASDATDKLRACATEVVALFEPFLEQA